MALITPAAVQKFKVTPSQELLTEKEIIAKCAKGELGRHNGYFASEKKYEVLPLTSFPKFAAAISAFEQAKEANAKRHAAEFSPDKLTRLHVRLTHEATDTTEYLPDQIRYRLLSGQLPASAEFKHPDYEDWFSCVPLVKDFDTNPLIKPHEALLAEIQELKTAMREVRAQTAKTKWATRATGLLLVGLIYCGFKIVVRLYA